MVGGVDSLCLTTLYGFHSLQLVAARPLPALRRGARRHLDRRGGRVRAARAPAADSLDAHALLLLGAGESSDAHHMSAPHPEGRGARAAMQAALSCAGCTAQDIDYINFHGTGTPSNDAAEALAVAAVLGHEVPGSSTKGATGHTLGAAGALEAVICALALREGLMPGGVNTHTVDPSLEVTYLRANRPAPPASRAQQLLRLRRLELQPRPRACRVRP